MSQLIFRPPSSSTSPSSSFTAPPPAFLHGSWYVTHSTLPMWKSNRNVVITYSPITSSSNEDLIDDKVTYQPLDSSKLKTVRGIDTPITGQQGAYKWRGKGWLMIASSQWEVLGFGEDEGGWVVTFFQKTLFTPAGVDVYARSKSGLSVDLISRIKEGMKGEGMGDDEFRRLVSEDVFEITHD